MRPPFLSFVTWNRMSLTVRNLSRLLESKEDFEISIIDNNSQDDTWEFLKSLNDPRIKSRIKFEKNRGPIYAYNYNLSMRNPDQYFITVDNDTYIHTEDWISRFMEVFNRFPEVGMLGIPRSNPYPEYMPAVLPKLKDGICYLRLKNALVNEPLDFVPKCCQIYRPELLELIGYWSEESGFADAEMSARITQYTPFTVGFATNIRIEQPQKIACPECQGKNWCSLDRTNTYCHKLWEMRYTNYKFAKQFLWKNLQFFEELKNDNRTVYCPSVHDPASLERIAGNVYHADWVTENFKFYADHAN